MCVFVSTLCNICIDEYLCIDVCMMCERVCDMHVCIYECMYVFMYIRVCECV